MRCLTFIEKCLLYCDGSIITCWNAVPRQQILCISEFLLLNASTNTPDGMKLFLQICCLRTLLNELLNQFQLLSITSFESTGIMKDETRVALEYHFVLDVMLPPLWCGYIIEHKSLIREPFLTFTVGLTADDSIWDYGQWMSVSGIKFHNMPHLFTIRTEDCRFFRSVAESLQDCCLACISPPDYKDTESSKLSSDFSNLLFSELRLWWGRHCERCSRCWMIRR